MCIQKTNMKPGGGRLEHLVESDDIAIARLLDTKNVNNTRPVKFQRMRRLYREDDPNCWGCRHSLGADGQDETTALLDRIVKLNMGIMNDATLYATLSNAHFELFVVPNPEKEKRWSVKSIEQHLKFHAQCDKYELISTLRDIKIAEQGILDDLFYDDETTGAVHFDSKKNDSYLKLIDMKMKIMAKLKS